MCLNNLKTKNKSNQFYSWLNAHFDDFTLSINPTTLSSQDWLVGFTDGDGSFYPMYQKNLYRDFLSADFRSKLLLI
jgi:hypothetical protein